METKSPYNAKTTNAAAFPVTLTDSGLTKREAIALAILAGLIAADNTHPEVELAIQKADRLLEELNK